MEPTWLTVLWVCAMALGLGIAIGRIQVGMKWVKADEKRRSQINVTLSSRGRYTRDDVRALLDEMTSAINPGDGSAR